MLRELNLLRPRIWEGRRKGLAPVVIRRPKPEPKDAVDIPPLNPDDPIDLESSPERLVRKKAGKKKQTDAGGRRSACEEDSEEENYLGG
ncbi:hypothetical protein Hanom_Chr15g01368881 [Helianthus anomalus]